MFIMIAQTFHCPKFYIMDNILDDDLSCFRIRSARRRRRAQKEDYDKMLLRLDEKKMLFIETSVH
jgi:hypothetical protein